MKNKLKKAEAKFITDMIFSLNNYYMQAFSNNKGKGRKMRKKLKKVLHISKLQCKQ